MSGPRRNELCPCGSGKKFKKCGYLNSREHQARLDEDFEFYRKFVSSELSFRAEISSEEAEPSSMVISGATFGDREVFSDPIELSVGGSGPAKASIEIPVGKKKIGKIATAGDGVVSNQTELYDVFVKGGKKLKAKSAKGLFASASAVFQRSLNVSVCHIYFGEAGKKETILANGEKDRPHIVLKSTGSGLFSRVSGYDCEVEANSDYDTSKKVISASKFWVSVKDWKETLLVKFEVDHEHRRILISEVSFVSTK